MTATAKIREALELSLACFNQDGDWIHAGITQQALTALDALEKEMDALREAVRDFGDVCDDIDVWANKLADVQFKHRKVNND